MQFLPTFILPAKGESGTAKGFGASRERSESSSFSKLLQHASSTAGDKGRDQVKSLLEAKASSLSAEGQEALSKARGLLAKAGASSRIASQSSSEDANGSGTGKLLNALLTAVGSSGKRSGLGMQSLTLTREDFAGLREGLAKYGFTSQELDELQTLVNSKGGLTWGRLVSATARKMAGLDALPVELSANETVSIQGFLQKAGCTPQEAEELIDKLRQGETTAVWQVLEGKLADQPEGAALDLDSDEIEALCKALRLDSDQQGRLRTAIKEDGSARLAIKDLQAVLSELKSDAAQQAADRSSTAAALRDLVAAAFESARDNAGVEAKADRRPGDEARRARLLAEAAEDERQAEEDEYRPLSGKRADESGEATGLASRLPGSGRSRLAQDSGKDGDATAGQGQDKNAGHKAGDQAATQTAQADARTEDQKAWAEFWGKVARDRAGSAEVKAAAKTTEPQNPTILAAETAAKAEAASVDSSPGLEKFAPRQVLRQVESGIYRSLNEGTKQLTLRLDPPELGKLSLQLTVRGQEVNVVLKAESADAGRMLHENMHQLRQTLEDQGLKVGKLEVQTQLSDGNQSQAWAGTDRHNEARERDEAARALDRMRVLRGGNAVVQEMQSGDVTAIHSHAGLSVIA